MATHDHQASGGAEAVRLAAQAGHELNNLVTALLGTVDGLRLEAAGVPEDHLQRLLRLATRAEALAGRLQGLAGGSTAAQESIASACTSPSVLVQDGCS